MKLGSLFDGSGGFPLAGALAGIEPIWSSEIEPYPLRVTATRFPNVRQLGDVTKINGAAVDPVNIITFGSPCQDLSVAGKQLGIHDGQRSNLFFEAVRIIKEMRDADKANGRTDVDVRPRFAVWENVPGAFSSNKGADFQAVLQAIAGVCENGISIPQPKKWGGAGCVVGDGWSIAWRVYDAQYWGVPQHRKRIYLVADFGSERAGEILFERESVSGDSSESGTAGKGTATDATEGIGGGRGVRCLNPWDYQSYRLYGVNGAFATLQAHENAGLNHQGVCFALQGNGIDRADTAGCNGRGWRTDQMYTLNTIDRPAIAIDCRNMVGNEEISGTLQAKSNGGYSLNYQNPICYRAGGYGDMVEGVGTLRANGGDAGGGTESIVIDVFDARGNGDGKTVPTLTGDHQNRVTDYTALCAYFSQQRIGQYTLDCASSTLMARDYKSASDLVVEPQRRKYIVRRLTPLECCRLQGFLDWWTDGVDGSDSAKYKMWGNGIALPCAFDVLNRVARFCKGENDGDGNNP